jgi:hypothetical protein
MGRFSSPLLAIILVTAAPPAASALSCSLDFTIEVTQGVGPIRPGTRLPGSAQYTTTGQSIRQDGGAMAHLAQGSMSIGEGISGPIWTLITTSREHATDLVGVYAHHIEGLSYGGIHFVGPMALTLYGAPGSRPEPVPPITQAEWDQLDIRRSFSLHAPGDMLAGDVLDLSVLCH